MVENAWTPRRQAMAYDQVHEAIARARATTAHLASLDVDTRNEALLTASKNLLARADELLAADALDRAVLDRDARLTDARIADLADRLARIAELPDPLGATDTNSPGRTMRIPLGVIGVVYDEQPSALVEATGLAWKSGNAVLLRGSQSMLNTDSALTEVLRDSLAEAGLPSDSVALLASTERSCTRYLVSATGLVDLILLRGGTRLVRAVSAEVKVPLIEAGPAVCHIYVDREADPIIAEQIVLDSSADSERSVLVHRDVADRLMPQLTSAADRMAMSTVDSLEDALAHIARLGTGHTELIVTQSHDAARTFIAGIDAATVGVNTVAPAPSRLFSTQKLQVRGLIGPEALTTTKRVDWADDQDCA